MDFLRGTGMVILLGELLNKNTRYCLRKADARKELRRAPHLRRLLERVSNLDQLRLAERAAEKRNPDRQTKNVTRRHCDVRITRNRRRRRIAAGEVVAIDPIGGPRWSTCRRNESIEPVLLHYRIDPLRARQQVVLTQRGEIGLTRERSFRLGFDHDVLPEVRHLAIAVLLVEGDHIFQRPNRRLWSKSRKVSVQIGFELIQQNFKLGIVKLTRRRNVSRIDKHCAESLHLREQVVHQLIDTITKPEMFARDAESHASQPVFVQKLRVIRNRFSATRVCRFVSWIDASHRAEKNRSVSHCSRHWTS